MANLIKIREELLADGKITTNEVNKIKEWMAANGELDVVDARLLVELMKDADSVCEEFDAMFFPCLREIILKDGQVGADEQFVLLQMLYSDGEVRQCERDFLVELYRSVDDVTPEFKHLCETALECAGTDWKLD